MLVIRQLYSSKSFIQSKTSANETLSLFIMQPFILHSLISLRLSAIILPYMFMWNFWMFFRISMVTHINVSICFSIFIVPTPSFYISIYIQDIYRSVCFTEWSWIFTNGCFVKEYTSTLSANLEVNAIVILLR